MLSRVRVATAAAVAASGLLGAWFYAQRHSHPPSNPVNAYVNAAVCTGCHADLAAGYRKTGMGRSFAPVRPEEVPQFRSPFHNKATDSSFAMIARDGKYYPRRWQIGFDGKEANVDEKQVDFVIGSGNHSRTYLHLSARNTLQVLPVSWYAEKGERWGGVFGRRIRQPRQERIWSERLLWIRNCRNCTTISRTSCGV